jgi:putative ABC transport system permease protein
VTPMLDHVFGPVRGALRLLWIAVAVLLLIACANVSGLMLSHVERRRHEDAIRLALGANRAAVARLWLTEIGMVALAGGALGLLAGTMLVRVIVALAPDDLPRVGDVTVDTGVALFTFLVVVAVAVFTGLMPLRQAGSVSLLEAFEGERATAGRQTLRARSVLLVGQIALSVVLLIAAGLVVRSFLVLRQTDLGFTSGRVLSLTVRPGSSTLPPRVWLRELLERVRAQPGVNREGRAGARGVARRRGARDRLRRRAGGEPRAPQRPVRHRA